MKSLADNIFDERNSKDTLTFDIEDSDLNDFTGIFYHKLKIVYGNTIETRNGSKRNINTSYVPLENNFDNKENKLNVVYIQLNQSKNYSKDKIIKSLMHELTHAWHDYNSYLHKKSKSLTTLGKESKYYHKIRKNSPKEKSEVLCKKIMYCLIKFEQNAYLSEIYSELEEYNGDVLDWNDAWNIFRNSSTYKQILSLYNELNDIENQPDKYKEEFVNYYNVNNDTKLTLNKILKILNNKFEKLFDKVLKNCSKVYFDWSEKQQKKFEVNENAFVHEDLDI